MAIQNPLYGHELSEGEAAAGYQPKSTTLTKLAALTTPSSGTHVLSIEGTELSWVPPEVPTITGAASTIVTDNLTASRVLISDANGKVITSPVTTTEVGYIAGVTSAVQAQINTLSGRTISVGAGLIGGGTISSNVSIGISYETTTSNIKMAGTANLGVLNTIPRADHVHPADTTRVSTSTLGAANGVATLDANTKVPVSQVPTITTTVGFGGEVISVPYTDSGITLPLPIAQGGTGTTTAVGALSALGGQPVSTILTTISSNNGAGFLVKDGSSVAQVRSLTVTNPLVISNASGTTGNPNISLSQGSGSGLDADLLDGLHGSSYLRADGGLSYSGGTASTIRGSILAAQSGSNSDITSLSTVTGLGNGSSTHVQITTSGLVGIGVNPITTNAGDVQVSRGLTFPSTQVPCSNVNTLDDYKEGTWTPAIDSFTPGTGRATTVYYARYTKIGNLVNVSCYVAISTLGSGGSGFWIISGLPFTNSASNLSAISVGDISSMAAPLSFLTGTIQPSSSYILMRGITTSSTASAALAFSTYVTTNTIIALTATYLT